MLAISDWYTSLGEYSFPTVFLRLSEDDCTALLAADASSAAARGLVERMQTAMDALPGANFVAADTCAPTDSPHFRAGAAMFNARTAWELLTTSPKVLNAFREGQTRRLIVRPFRRMDKTREFRMFVRDRRLAGMSQYCLERHFGRLEKREEEIWRLGNELMHAIAPGLPAADLAADVYLTSRNQFLIVDLNPWGPPTDPLLFRTWDRDWETPAGLKLIPKPVKMNGDISISF